MSATSSYLEIASKTERYAALEAGLRAMLDGERDPVLIMSTVACELHHAFDYFDWTGFYRVVQPELLAVGPYQGGMAAFIYRLTEVCVVHVPGPVRRSGFGMCISGPTISHALLPRCLKLLFLLCDNQMARWLLS